MLFDISLVDEQRGRRILLALDFLTVFGQGSRLVGRNHRVDGELHEPLDADVLLRGKAEDREHFAPTDSETEAFPDLLFREGAFFKEFLHKSIVEFRGCLNQLLTEIVCLGLQVRRNVKVFAGPVRILEMVIFHFEDINESVERSARIDRELHDGQLFPEDFLHGVEGKIPVRFFCVELIDRDDNRNLVPTGITRENLSADFHTLLRIDDKNTIFADLEGGHCASYEVVGTRSVDDVELRPHEFRVHRGREDRLLLQFFDFFVV